MELYVIISIILGWLTDKETHIQHILGNRHPWGDVEAFVDFVLFASSPFYSH